MKIPAKFQGLDVYTVSELRNALSLLVKNTFTAPLMLRGVIASEPSIYPTFAYMDLRDEKENMTFNLSFYIGNYYNIEKKLKVAGVVDKLTKDVPVMLIVEPYVSTQKRISFTLKAIDIIPEYTASVLANEKNITLAKLEAEGLLGLQKALVLPRIIKNIGLISSEQGTSIQDISSAMADTKGFFNIYFAAVRVEGPLAISSIIEAMTLFNSSAKDLDLDVILIARGGGSSAELSVFNDYELCRTVCLSKVPVISAIGHDKDQHAIEFCSHIVPTPSTPSGIGAYLRQNIHEARQDLFSQIQRINTALVERFIREEALVSGYLNDTLASVKRSFFVNIEKIKNSLATVLHEIRRTLDNKGTELNALQKIIEAYDHRTVLKRGYAVVWNNGVVIKSSKEMKDNASIEFQDGYVDVSKKV